MQIIDAKEAIEAVQKVADTLGRSGHILTPSDMDLLTRTSTESMRQVANILQPFSRHLKLDPFKAGIGPICGIYRNLLDTIGVQHQKVTS